MPPIPPMHHGSAQSSVRSIPTRSACAVALGLLLATLPRVLPAESHWLRAEYVLAQGNPDNDPGPGQGNPIPIEAFSGSGHASFTVPPSVLAGLNPGLWRLAVRVQGPDGLWSTAVSRTFRLGLPPLPPDTLTGEVDALEWIVARADSPGSDPGPGQGNPLPVPSGTQAQFTLTPAQVEALTPGVYRLGVRARTDADLWGLMLTRTFVVPERVPGQPYYPRWTVRQPDGTVAARGSLQADPIARFPYRTLQALPVGSPAPGMLEVEVSLEDFQGFPGTVEARTVEWVSHPEFWHRTYFTLPAERADPQVSGPLADPNHDGWTNLESFVLGLDPQATGDIPPMGLTVERSGTGSATVRLRTPPALPEGTGLRVRTTPSLHLARTPALSLDSPLTPDLDPAFAAPVEVDPRTGHRTWTLDPLDPTPWTGAGFFQLDILHEGPWVFPP